MKLKTAKQRTIEVHEMSNMKGVFFFKKGKGERMKVRLQTRKNQQNAKEKRSKNVCHDKKLEIEIFGW